MIEKLAKTIKATLGLSNEHYGDLTIKFEHGKIVYIYLGKSILDPKTKQLSK